MDFKDVNILKDIKIPFNSKWVYSAGFNIKPDLKSSERADEELEDLERLVSERASVVILANQGRQVDKDTRHLDYVAGYLSTKLGKEVLYYPENHTNEAVEFAHSLKPGQIAILGNTRFHAGEEANNVELSLQFAKLGKYVAAGGFSKAHRTNASNVGILQHLPGFLTSSQIKQMELLAPWSEESGNYSVAILGGLKKEKITKGLVGLSKKYDVIIPGGIVLNTLLKQAGYEIGDSVIRDSGETFEQQAKQIFDKYPKKILLPSKVQIATTNSFQDPKWISISKGVPKGYQIVDFKLSDLAIYCLEQTLENDSRILVAGTPGISAKGFTTSTNQIIPYLEHPNTQSVVLGGDSINDIPFSGTKSTGGGTALEFLCTGTTTVFEALKTNKQKFPRYIL